MSEEENIPDLNELLNHFKPASNIQDSNLQLTTIQIFNIFQQHFPGEFYNPMDVYRFLEENGFISLKLPEGGNIVWLLME